MVPVGALGVLTSGSDSGANSLTLSVAAKQKHFAGIWLDLSWPPLLLALLVQPLRREAGWAGQVRCRLKAAWFSSACFDHQGSRRISSAGPIN